MPEKDYDVKINDGSTTRRFRLLQQRGQKSWRVQELPPNPRVESNAAAREGLPPSQLLPFDGQDFSWGAGLSRYTPQAERPGHVLRYADGFGIDTTEAGVVKHGPAVTSIGTTNNPIKQAVVFNDTAWFLTEDSVYTWDGCTFTQEFLDCDDDFVEMEVHDTNLFIAAGTSYWWTDGTGIGGCVTFTEEAFAATHLLSLNGVLWRATSTQISSSDDPADCCPTWTTLADVGDGSTIRNLFTISGLLGAETNANLFIIDENLASIELNKGLRNRRAAATTVAAKSESGTDVWLTDGIDLRHMLAVGFELFDLGPDGPFFSTDERPVTDFPAGGAVGYIGVTQDLDDVYVFVSRAQGDYIYKGVELSRNVFAWTPLVKRTTGSPTFIQALKTSGDTSSVVYFNDGTALSAFDVEWTTFASDWELETVRFTATLPAWDKLWDKVTAFLDRETSDAKVTVSRRLDTTAGYSVFGSTGLMTGDGSNEIIASTPLSGKQIQLKFAGNTTDANDYVNLHSFLLEGYLRPDYRRTYDFTVVADSPEDVSFIEGLRTNVTGFITLTDRFNTDRTVIILPGSPIEEEITDEIRKAPVRTYHIIAQETHS